MSHAARNIFRPDINAYVVYHQLLAVTDGFRRPLRMTAAELAHRLQLSPEAFDAAVQQLQLHGYLEGRELGTASAVPQPCFVALAVKQVRAQ